MNAPATEMQRLYRLGEAVHRFFPDGRLSVRSLRTEAAAGRLQLIKIANKHFVTAEAIKAMLERCTCHASVSRLASTSENAPDATRNGSSLTERERSAQAALQLILLGQKKR